MGIFQETMKGFVYRLPHDCHLDFDRDVSTAHCRSPSHDSVYLLSRTICTTVVVSDLCINSLDRVLQYSVVQKLESAIQL